MQPGIKEKLAHPEIGSNSIVSVLQSCLGICHLVKLVEERYSLVYSRVSYHAIMSYYIESIITNISFNLIPIWIRLPL